jgi:hypothetical protein
MPRQLVQWGMTLQGGMRETRQSACLEQMHNFAPALDRCGPGLLSDELNCMKCALHVGGFIWSTNRHMCLAPLLRFKSGVS